MNALSQHLTRRNFNACGLASLAGVAGARFSAAMDSGPPGLHEQILASAAKQERARRECFAAVKSRSELQSLQTDLRERFLQLLGGLPERDSPVPPAKIAGQIFGEGYTIDKLTFESLPGYFVTALLYKPRNIAGKCPGVISPCGHSTEGKAAASYQMLHINLARRGYVVLTYDPVGQAERSQFWSDSLGKSRYNLTCGEHAVLGNPLYLIGDNLATYRIWDGIRALDLLAAQPEVDAERLGCVGNSGGGTLTAYIAALDPRVACAAICCYLTTLPRRMANRIEADPDADPEQDIFGFVSEGIDHAGLVALRVPKPTLIGAARHDFFPIEGTRESYAEARRLYEVAGAGERLEMVEAPEKHGLSLPLRTGIYGWFDRWLKSDDSAKMPPDEIKVLPRPARQLLVSANGQVNGDLNSRHLFEVALKRFHRRSKANPVSVRELLELNLRSAAPLVEKLVEIPEATTTLLLVNGNEAADWREATKLLDLCRERGWAAAVVDPRGVGRQRPELAVRGHDYADPLCGVEENLAYNAFLTGQSLGSMRVADVLAAVAMFRAARPRGRLVLCGRRDSALVALLAAACEPAITHLASEQLLVSLRSLFDPATPPLCAASIVPGLLSRVGDIAEVAGRIAPRPVLMAAGIGTTKFGEHVRQAAEPFSSQPGELAKWLGGA
ncbi:MAG: acetylxylan esterase [Pirellulaceae bacterium]|nr:acetylxylan esterase [Pirellulaceae bacterium]